AIAVSRSEEPERTRLDLVVLPPPAEIEVVVARGEGSSAWRLVLGVGSWVFGVGFGVWRRLLRAGGSGFGLRPTAFGPLPRDCSIAARTPSRSRLSSSIVGAR